VTHPLIANVNWSDGALSVEGLRSSVKKLRQLKGIFADEQAYSALDPETIVYRVWWWQPVELGTTGGLLWGTTEIEPGKVGDEYYMTHGHRHVIADRAEFYGTTMGTGKLVLRDAAGHAWAEDMAPGSLHYIAGHVAHRVVNTGDTPLRFVACWSADAGHDYDLSGENAFGIRIVEHNGKPTEVSANKQLA
jgi:glucose-6-phosphate isomerase